MKNYKVYLEGELGVVTWLYNDIGDETPDFLEDASIWEERENNDPYARTLVRIDELPDDLPFGYNLMKLTHKSIDGELRVGDSDSGVVIIIFVDYYDGFVVLDNTERATL